MKEPHQQVAGTPVDVASGVEQRAGVEQQLPPFQTDRGIQSRKVRPAAVVVGRLAERELDRHIAPIKVQRGTGVPIAIVLEYVRLVRIHGHGRRRPGTDDSAVARNCAHPLPIAVQGQYQPQHPVGQSLGQLATSRDFRQRDVLQCERIQTSLPVPLTSPCHVLFALGNYDGQKGEERRGRIGAIHLQIGMSNGRNRVRMA